MGLRSRVADWLEDTLPWYNKDRERAKFAQFKVQVEASQKVRLAVNHEIATSRRDRRSTMRSSFHAAGRRLGER